VIERRKASRDMERWIESSGHRRRQSNPFRRSRHGRQKLQRLQHVDLPTIAHNGGEAVVVEFHQRKRVDKEQPVKLAALENARDILIACRIQCVDSIAFRVSPRPIMVPGGAGNDIAH
jgi:hypothetical protein